MVLSIEERIKGFLFNPSETFDASKEDTLGDSLTYFVVVLTIFAVIFGAFYAIYSAAFSLIITRIIASILGTSMPPFMAAMGPLIGLLFFVLFFVLILVVGIIAAFIGGLWTHIWVYLVGGRRGVAQTIKAVMYGSTPSFLLTPLLPWAFIVQVIGIRQLQELSTGRTILAVILAIIIPAIIIAAIFAAYIPTMPMLRPGPGLGPEHMIRP